MTLVVEFRVLAPVTDDEVDALLLPTTGVVGAATGPAVPPAANATPSEGVAWHVVAERLLVKLTRPSAESGSDAPAGSVPT